MQILLANDKKQQRKIFLQQRRALSWQQKETYSQQIVTKILESDAYKTADVCFLYASMADEVQTKALIEESLRAGKRVCLPYITDKDNSMMEAAEIFSLSELKTGAYGILSVAEDKLRIVAPEQLDFVLIPAVAVDKNGYRLGMGGGYYDRYIARTHEAKLIAAVYDCQLAECVPTDEHDIRVDAIITEKQIIKLK